MVNKFTRSKFSPFITGVQLSSAITLALVCKLLSRSTSKLSLFGVSRLTGRDPDLRDRGSAEHPQKIYNSEREDKSDNSEAVGVGCAKKSGSVLILLLRGVS